MSGLNNIATTFKQFLRPSPAPQDAKFLDFEKGEILRKTQLLQTMCRILAFVELALSLIYLSYGFIYQRIWYFLGTGLSLAGFLVLILSLYLARTGKYNAAAWWLIGAIFSIVLYSLWLTGTAVVIVIGFMLPLALAIALMTTRQVVLIAGVVIAYSSFWYVCENALKIIKPLINSTPTLQTLNNLFVFFMIVPAVVALLVLPARSQLKAMRTQYERLRATLSELEERQRTGLTVSQQVLSLTAQLTSTATQQASGSQEQVEVVTQVGTSVVELSAAAGQIAELAGQINQAAEVANFDSASIEQIAASSVNQSQAGLNAVKRTLEASQQVAELYQGLVDTLEDLAAKHANMSVILRLLNDLSRETHLLSLNAAIEAAGAGEYGDRFGVVAQQVKNLASRSASANKEVVGIISAIETAVLHAQHSATEGYVKADLLQVEAHQTGQVIGQLEAIAGRCHFQARKVNQAIQQVSNLSEIIQVATSQQRTANDQMREVLQGLGKVANESASGSQFISTAVIELEDLSSYLSQSLKIAA